MYLLTCTFHNLAICWQCSGGKNSGNDFGSWERTFFFSAPPRDVQSKFFESLFFQIWNDTLHELIFDTNVCSFWPDKTSVCRLLAFISLSTACDMMFSISTSIILRNRWSSSGTTWSRLMNNKGAYLTPYMNPCPWNGKMHTFWCHQLIVFGASLMYPSY